MNIKFGMNNFFVRYLKRFLHHELDQDSRGILGKFEKKDLEQLITYLNLPNVKDMFNVQKEILDNFPDLNILFNYRLKDDEIIFKSKSIDKQSAEFLSNNLSDIEAYCESVGWKIEEVNEWIDISKDINSDGNVNNLEREILENIIYNGVVYDESIMKKADLNLDGKIDNTDMVILDDYLNNNKLSLVIKKTARKNFFPNKDMLVFINQFDGTFLYNYAIRDQIGIDDKPHPNNENKYKIALYKCSPGQKITIAHNSPKSVHMIIGSSPATLKQNITGFMLNNVKEIDLAQGQGYQYTCSKASDGTGYNANYVCIQVPSSYGDLGGRKEVTISIQLGDINLDGEVNMQDYQLLAKYTAYGPGSEELHWTPTRRQLAAMDLNGDGIVDNKDTLIFEQYLKGYIPSLGIAPYTYTIQEDSNNTNNVENLLIIDGHYYNDDYCTDGDINIPFNEFVSNDWIIHDKFFTYLIDMAIQPYTDSNDITYAQKLLKQVYPEYTYNENIFYPGNYNNLMRKVVKDFQASLYHFEKGDLNSDNKLDELDLLLLREYLDDPQHQRHIEDPDNEPDSTLLSDIQKQRADINLDGVVDETDYELLRKEVYGETKNLKTYDTTFNLGYIDTQVEKILEDNYNNQGFISEVSK